MDGPILVGFELRRSDVLLMTVSRTIRGGRLRWYHFGLGQNSLNRETGDGPVSWGKMDAVKRDAMKVLKAHEAGR